MFTGKYPNAENTTEFSIINIIMIIGKYQNLHNHLMKAHSKVITPAMSQTYEYKS